MHNYNATQLIPVVYFLGISTLEFQKIAHFFPSHFTERCLLQKYQIGF